MHTMVSYLRLGLPFFFLIGAWRFGDWRNWKKYYPTILFLVTVDFGISIVMYEHPLWTFEKSFLIQNHTIIDFFNTFLGFSPMVLIYLSKYPYHSRWLLQLVYGFFWVLFGTTLES